MLSFFRVFCVFFSLVVSFCCGWTPSTKHSHSAFENTLCHLISFSRYPNEIPEPSDAICLQVKKNHGSPHPVVGKRTKRSRIFLNISKLAEVQQIFAKMIDKGYAWMFVKFEEIPWWAVGMLDLFAGGSLGVLMCFYVTIHNVSN